MNNEENILTKLYDKRLEYEYQIENYAESSIERTIMETKFNTMYEAECIVRANQTAPELTHT